MKKHDMKKIALLGVAGGMLVAGQASALDVSNNQVQPTLLAAGCAGGCGHKASAKRNGNLADNEMRSNDPSAVVQVNDEAFKSQLNEKGRELYNSLSDEGKANAREIAGKYADKNEAVKEAAKNNGKKPN